jgi:hypothetical protein
VTDAVCVNHNHDMVNAPVLPIAGTCYPTQLPPAIMGSHLPVPPANAACCVCWLHLDAHNKYQITQTLKTGCMRLPAHPLLPAEQHMLHVAAVLLV